MNLLKDFSKILSQTECISLLQAAEKKNLSNSNLLICNDPDIGDFVARAVAKKILSVDSLENCLDFFSVRPLGLMRQISVDQIRDVRSSIYLSPKACPKKFVLISESERMNTAAANAFLKTLEEPPLDTTIFLTSSRLHAVLPTIASRCCILRLNIGNTSLDDENIDRWAVNYLSWLNTLLDAQNIQSNGAIMPMYLLLSQLECLISKLMEISEENDSKQIIYQKIFRKIADTTSEFFRGKIDHVKLFPRFIDSLEDKAELVALNVNFMSCIESFFIEIFQIIIKLFDRN